MLKNISKPLVGLLMVMGSVTASAATYSFTQITSNGNTDVSAQLSVDVVASGSDILFTFYNNVGLSSSVADIYFDLGNTNFFDSISNDVLGAAGETAGVAFSDDSSPPNLPSGQTISFTAEFSGGSDGAPNGIDSSLESASFLGDTFSGITLADVLAGIESGAFRIGLHVQSIDQIGGGDESESYVNAVPIPAAGWLFGTALIGLMGLKRRKL